MPSEIIKPVIVVAAFKRVRSLARLLEDLLNADYPDKNVHLVVSVDFSGDDNVASFLKDFHWPHGPFEVILHPQNLGLRNHIISCGDLSLKYGSVIVLEDDLGVAPAFYSYATAALRFYSNYSEIAGISLYRHSIAIPHNRPFSPIQDSGDCFFLQFPMSWGEAWTKEMWEGFKSWYANEDNQVSFSEYPGVPSIVAHWPDSSWLKYFTRYLVDTGKTFAYPYFCFTTNYGDAGTHVQFAQPSRYQSNLLYSQLGREWYFQGPEAVLSSYDPYFENLCLGRFFSSEEPPTIDLYGGKPEILYSRYVVSSRLMPYQIEQSFGMIKRPHERNIVDSVPGDGFFLFDRNAPQLRSKNMFHRKVNELQRLAAIEEYDSRGLSWRKMLKVFMGMVLKWYFPGRKTQKRLG